MAALGWLLSLFEPCFCWLLTLPCGAGMLSHFHPFWTFYCVVSAQTSAHPFLMSLIQTTLSILLRYDRFGIDNELDCHGQHGPLISWSNLVCVSARAWYKTVLNFRATSLKLSCFTLNWSIRSNLRQLNWTAIEPILALNMPCSDWS